MNKERAKNLLLIVTVTMLITWMLGALAYNMLTQLATVQSNVQKILSH